MKDKHEDDVIFKNDDREIKKSILRNGKWANKPYECSECEIKVENCQAVDVHKYNSAPYVIGNSENEFERMLDICLTSMFEGEIAEFTVTAAENYTFKVSLYKFDFQGFIYNWDAKKKYKIALNHKEKGVELFKKEKVKDAAYRFTKGLKIVLSIPLDVEYPPVEVDGLRVEEISALKANLYNNMASCYLKNDRWDLVIEFCNKVFHYDKDNVKALYKIGVAFRYDKNFENAEKAFKNLLQLEPDHKAAVEHLQSVQLKLKEANARVNNMVKKMFKEANE